jgi:HAD superfamily hydrolase (TIGR01484 family)
MSKLLIATDFDGTFIRNGKIDPADLEAIADWRHKGRLFGFVTGRGSDFFNTAREYGVEADFFLLYTGALLALPDGTVCKEYLIPRSVFARLEAHFRAIPDVCWFNEADDAPFYHQYYATMETPERALQVAEGVNRLFGDEVTAYVNGPHVNIGKKGSGKAQGVFDALDYFRLPRDAAAVFGDDFNDMDMLRVHNGWAVATARPEVLAMAPHVCESVGKAAKELMINDTFD